MGEYIACSFQVGGKLTRVQAEELIECAMSEYGLPNDIGKTPANQGMSGELVIEDVGARWMWYEINYGNLDALIDYCAAADIDYEYWSDRGSEWHAHIQRVVGGEITEFTCNNDGKPFITLDELTRTDALATGWADLHQRVKRWKEGLPKAEIVG